MPRPLSSRAPPKKHTFFQPTPFPSPTPPCTRSAISAKSPKTRSARPATPGPSRLPPGLRWLCSRFMWLPHGGDGEEEVPKSLIRHAQRAPHGPRTARTRTARTRKARMNPLRLPPCPPLVPVASVLKDPSLRVDVPMRGQAVSLA
jgi:hypothetical protein